MNRQAVNSDPHPDQLRFKYSPIADHHSLIAAVNDRSGDFNCATLNPSSVQGRQNLNNNRASNRVVFGHKFLNDDGTKCYNDTGNASASLWQRPNFCFSHPVRRATGKDKTNHAKYRPYR